MGPAAIHDSPEGLCELLCTLVGWPSVTGTDGERRFGTRLAALLRELPCFAGRPELVVAQPVEGGRHYVTALHLAPGVADTIVLVSHFDTVDTADYGPLESLACEPLALTDAIAQLGDVIGGDAAADAASGEYLFGRGSMDMKAGLALHVALLERAAAEGWPINLLLLAVPDEEVNSEGMRTAVAALPELARMHGLRYRLFLNGEPVFPAEPGDERRRIYTGSIGKLLPSVLCYGRETHAGTPLAGLTSTWMASYVTQAVEWNDDLREHARGEVAPLPVTLEQRDLREGYSTQTPYRTAALYNVFVLERTAAEVMDRFESVVAGAAARCSDDYRDVCAREGAPGVGDIRVLRYEALLAHARVQLAPEELGRTIGAALAAGGAGVDHRDQAIAVADALLRACQELTPAIVVMFAPPCYPSVNSSDDLLVQRCVEFVQAQARDRFGIELVQSHWFNGISDSSYVGGAGGAGTWAAFERNAPAYGISYAVPFAAMEELDAPVLNLGPFGKDPHQRTERVHRRSAFVETSALLADLVQFVAGSAAS